MEPGAHSVANRDEPVPVITDKGKSVLSKPSGADKPAQNRIWPLTATRPQEDATAQARQASSSNPSHSSMQDKVFAMIFKQVFPEDAPLEDAKPDQHSSAGAQRPNFSLPVMSANFRRFNARIGIVFVLQAQAAKLFSWRQPTQTLSFLAAYSFCCLEPPLLALLPMVMCILFLMIPAFHAKHPPPPNKLPADGYEIHGPAAGRAPEVTPAPEMSKDFFRNMRDLQNSMEDFTVVHDRVVNVVGHLTNFSDERLSSGVFLVLVVATTVTFFGSGLIPWRFVFLVLGWLAVCCLHPSAVKFLQSVDKRPLKRQAMRARSGFLRWVGKDVVLDAAPERREVEIFELQRRNEEAWEPWMYAVSPYTPRSPLRISGDRPRGTRYFEDVQPPRGWEWSSKKWALDLLSRDWVEDRMVTAVEVEMEGERWVYDISADDPANIPAGETGESKAQSDWEVGTGLEAKGEWRRRRWTRRVQRKSAQHEPPPSK